jgi:ABC-2 type transport system ATP-binding protein
LAHVIAERDQALVSRSLTTSYGTARGIVDVDLEMSPGEVLGLVGANGAGKTTFMRTLLDFVRPSSGSVTVFGHDSVSASVEVRRMCTYLPGELVIPPRLTGHDALRRFTFARGALDDLRLRAIADRLDLDLSRRVGELSKGNKQKVGLVLAFGPPSHLIVLDEPTSGLDPLLQREFAALVAEAVAAGSTVLLSSHVMSEVEQIATRVALMREGRVVSVDAIASITARARRRGRVRPRDLGDTARIAAALDGTDRVSEVVVEDGSVRFACTGDMDDLVHVLSGFRVAALDLAHADLEDAFFSAYAEGSAGTEQEPG